MGTRSLTIIKDGKETLVTLYRQYDGYPTGLGKDIKQALHKGLSTLTSGYNSKQIAPKVFNGMGCLAAWLVGDLKEGTIGNVYLYPKGSKDVGEEFIYTLTDKDGLIHLKVKDVYKKKIIFNGLLKTFNPNKFE